MKKKLSSYFLISFPLFFPLLIYSQTIIKEKVTVSPTAITPKISEANSSCGITVNFSWEAENYEGFVGISNSSGWVAVSDWTKGGAISCYAVLESLYAIITLKLNLDDGVSSNFSYSIIMNGVTIQSGSGTLMGKFTGAAYTTVGLNPTVYSGFTLDMIDGRTGSVTTELKKGQQLLTAVNPYLNCEGTPFLGRSSIINFSITPQIDNVAFFNSTTGENLGTAFSAPLPEIDQYYISLEPDYLSNEEKEMYVRASSGDYSRIDTLKIAAVRYSIYVYPEVVFMNSYSRMVEVNSYSDNGGEPLPDNIKFNLEIIDGGSLIDLALMPTGEKGKVFNNITHDHGFFIFDILPVDERPMSDDTLLIRISTTNPSVEPKDLRVIYTTQKIDVKFQPSTIAAGDTALVILKKKNSDGTLSDFPETQNFDVDIISGMEYGTLYVPQWGDLSDNFYGIPSGFKFIAEEGITEQNVESMILVRTTSGIISARGTLGKGNKQYSIQNRTEEEQLWGSATITIGDGGDCSDAPQCEGEPTVPQIVIVEHNNGAFGQNLCEPILNPHTQQYEYKNLGATRPIIGKNLCERIQYEVCYNNALDTWQINMSPIKFNIIKDICMNTVENKNYILIEDLSQVPEEDFCKALDDILGHLVYPYDIPYGHFAFKNIVMKHEEMHRNSFEKDLNKHLPEINEKIRNYKLSCSAAPNVNEATNRAYLFVNEIIADYVRDAIREWNFRNGGSEENERYWEILTNMEDEVFTLAWNTYFELKSLYPEKNCPNAF